MTETRPALCLSAGTYRDGGGRGLYAVRPGEGGEWTVGDAYSGAANASFSVYSARYGLHYIVNEQKTGSVGVYRHGEGGWESLASVATQGEAPCHLALDRTETLLAVANYGSGSVSLIRLDERDGLPRGAAQVHGNRGSGPNKERQEGPHAHWVGFDADGRRLYQTDLGTDQILAFDIDRRGGLGRAQTAYAAPPGSGPRHLLLHPTIATRAYLVSELANTLTTLDHRDGAFREPRIVSTLPDGWQGDSIAAHIAINRACDRLYVSNRGHDSIAVFALDGDGVPTLIQHAPAGGASPRFFLLLEDQQTMVIANEKARTLTTLAIAADGRLTPTGTSRDIPGIAYVLMAEPAAFHRRA